MSEGPPPADKLKTSSRDDAELAERLEQWLVSRTDLGPDVRVEECHRPESNGMSSDTLLFDASWRAGSSGRERQSYVARLRPADDACPIFPHYDLDLQVRVMRLVGDRTAAPVPRVHWHEPDEDPLGAPFFVMDRVAGDVPPDVLPYPFDGSWVQEATEAQRAHLQARTVDVVAAIHGLAATPAELAFLRAGGPAVADREVTPLRAHFLAERSFYEWAREDLRFPILERAFDWLDARWPEGAEEADPVVCWGDARIGNILYRDFEPQAVLDWEMAVLAPRELDLGWLIFLHRFFDDITTDLGMAGLPTFLQRPDVEAQYAERTGHQLRDMDWFITYAALRHGTVMTRAMRRRVLFGEVEMPADPEELILHRAALAELIDS